MISDHLSRLSRGVRNTVAFGVQLATSATGALPKVQVSLAGVEIRDRLSMVQHYGFASRPPAGTKHVVLFVGGDRSNGVSVATVATGKIPNLLDSEVAIYAFDNIILVRQDGIVMTAPKVTIEGDLQVMGTVTQGAAGATVGLGTHHHSNTGPPTPGT